MRCWISIPLFESQPGTGQWLLIASSVCACQLHSLVYFYKVVASAFELQA